MAATETASLRRSFYLLMTTVAVSIAIAKIVGAENVIEPSRYTPTKAEGYSKYPPDPPRKWPPERPEPTPMFGSNDRSRWATIRALVDKGEYKIGERKNFRDQQGPWQDEGIIFSDGYQSLDKVMDPETGIFYSSKPPLMPTVLAGEYWILKNVCKLSIVDDRWIVVCTILIATNVLPFLIYLLLLARLIEDHATTDFAKLFTFTAACFGTFLTTFSVTLNNHNPATYCALFAIYPLLRKDEARPELSGGMLFLSGFFASLTAVLELPAAALLAGLLLPMLYNQPRRTLCYFIPGLLIPIAAMFATNYLAMGRLLPAYSEFGGPWYNYPGSHWAKLGTPAAKGIDFAQEPKHVYAFHLLLGHHGWFSLTPVWIIGACGLAMLTGKSGEQIKAVLLRRVSSVRTLWSYPIFGALVLTVSTVVTGFYIWQTNNYGGFTSAPRWLIWLTPLWLLALLPALDWLSKCRVGRAVSVLFLGVSVLSVFYPAWNPWRPPWILQMLEVNDWLRY